MMQSDVELAERYRKEADKFAQLARSTPPGAFSDVFLETAVRYLRMSKELEHQGSEPQVALWEWLGRPSADEPCRPLVH
jgi:hypothetical protein